MLVLHFCVVYNFWTFTKLTWRNFENRVPVVLVLELEGMSSVAYCGTALTAHLHTGRSKTESVIFNSLVCSHLPKNPFSQNILYDIVILINYGSFCLI